MFEIRAQAAARRNLYKDTKIPFFKAMLAGQIYTYVSFDGKTFEPVEKKTKTSFRGKEHPKSQQRLMDRIERRPSERICQATISYCTQRQLDLSVVGCPIFANVN
jgi:hypothetical protein